MGSPRRGIAERGAKVVGAHRFQMWTAPAPVGRPLLRHPLLPPDAQSWNNRSVASSAGKRLSMRRSSAVMSWAVPKVAMTVKKEKR